MTPELTPSITYDYERGSDRVMSHRYYHKEVGMWTPELYLDIDQPMLIIGGEVLPECWFSSHANSEIWMQSPSDAAASPRLSLPFLMSHGSICPTNSTPSLIYSYERDSDYDVPLGYKEVGQWALTPEINLDANEPIVLITGGLLHASPKRGFSSHATSGVSKQSPPDAAALPHPDLPSPCLYDRLHSLRRRRMDHTYI